MKKNVLITAMLFAAGSLLAADPKDTVTAAGKKMADGGNYTWKQTTENAGGGGGFGGGGPQVSQGKTAGGLTWTSTPGFAFGGGDAPPPTERLFKGTNSATKNQDGKWQTAEEIAAEAAANGGGGGGGGFGGGFGGGGGRRGGFGGFGGFGVQMPATNVAYLAGLTKSLSEAGGVISGDLTDDAAKGQITFGGRGRRGGFGGGGGGGGAAPEPSDAKASVKFWMTGGNVTKYELKVSGKLTGGPNGDIEINRTTTLEFSDIGSTKIDAPADIVAKLSK